MAIASDETETPADEAETTADKTNQDDEFGDKGSEGKYWDVNLVRPPGASDGLTAYIDMAEAAIQTAVDLLGRGMPTPPPEVGELLSKVTRETLGKGEADAAYQDTLTKVDEKQSSLLDMDTQVTDTSIVMAAEQDRVLKTIIDIVERLNGVLTKVGSAELKPGIEIQLLELIATAINLVYDKVTEAAKLSTDVAGDSSDEGSGGNGKPAVVPTGGAAGGMGGLGAMLPMLAMVPMSLMPLATTVLPELLDPDKDKDKGGEGAATDEEAVEPIDPTAPRPEATAPEGQPAPAGPDGNQEPPSATPPPVPA